MLPPELDILEKLNARCSALVRSCLRPQSQRPSASELLLHEFLAPHAEEDFQEVRIKISGDDTRNGGYAQWSISEALREEDSDSDSAETHHLTRATSLPPAESNNVDSSTQLHLDPAASAHSTDIRDSSARKSQHVDALVATSARAEPVPPTAPPSSSSKPTATSPGGDRVDQSPSTVALSDALHTKGAVSHQLVDASEAVSGHVLSGEQKGHLTPLVSGTPRDSNPEKPVGLTSARASYASSNSLYQGGQSGTIAPHKAEVFVVSVCCPADPSGDCEAIKIQLRVSSLSTSRKDSKETDIEFEFHLHSDDTRAVASEMRECEELAAIDIEIATIIDAIDPIVSSARNVVLSSGASLSPHGTYSEQIVSELLASPSGAKTCFKLLRGKADPRSSLASATVSPSGDLAHNNSKHFFEDADSKIKPALDLHSRAHLREAHAAPSSSSSADAAGDDLFRVLPVDFDDDEDEHSQEFLDTAARYQEQIHK